MSRAQTVERELFRDGLPSAVESERALLGACLLHRCAPPAMKALSAGDYIDEANRRIHVAIVALDDLGKTVEDISVIDFLRRDERIESVGGAAYVASLSESLPGSPECAGVRRADQESKHTATAGSVGQRHHNGRVESRRSGGHYRRGKDAARQCEAR